jgi:hypothetical protein
MVNHLGFLLLCVVCVMTTIVVNIDVIAHDNCQVIMISHIIKFKLILHNLT